MARKILTSSDPILHLFDKRKCRKNRFKKNNFETLFPRPIFVFLGRELLAKFSILTQKFLWFQYRGRREIRWTCMTLSSCDSYSAKVNSLVWPSFPVVRMARRYLTCDDPISYGPNSAQVFRLVRPPISSNSNRAKGSGLAWPKFLLIRIVRRSMPLYDPYFLWFEWREGIWPWVTLISCDSNTRRSLNDPILLWTEWRSEWR